MANESGSDENLCFFITRIGEEGSPEREQADGVMDAIVKPAAEKLGLECIRADQLPDPGQITTQIIDRIVSDKMVVADLTGGNPNVYYELAVRNSFRLPTALLAQEGERLPFDTSVMRTIFYVPDNMKSVAAARDKLVGHMKSAFEGAVDSPISTAVDLASLRVGNPTQRQLAEIVRSLERLGLENQEIKRLLVQATVREPVLPPTINHALRRAHEELQGQLSDDPPPLEVEQLARRIQMVHAYFIGGRRGGESVPAVYNSPELPAAPYRVLGDPTERRLLSQWVRRLARAPEPDAETRLLLDALEKEAETASPREMAEAIVEVLQRQREPGKDAAGPTDDPASTET